MAINQSSGAAGIVFWINQHFKLKEDQSIDKRDPRVLKIKEWIDRQYAEGRTTVIGDEELEEVIRTETPDLWRELAAHDPDL